MPEEEQDLAMSGDEFAEYVYTEPRRNTTTSTTFTIKVFFATICPTTKADKTNIADEHTHTNDNANTDTR